ncbi:carbonic anhydrase [Crucibulum laeve]|uniref:Carbonic anhydrase n=1 Tax=Crucibulum laeve TaxID=68775 RepID=A0A5C3MAV1_9AGAR|nr:carbonic anhydrase [Crucibulum laeve]
MSRPQHNIQRLLTANARWAEDVKKAEPGFFEESAKGQNPHTLWIGCADSRVPDAVITGAKPGEIFVHRNIAKYAFFLVQSPRSLTSNHPSQLHLSDDNVLSVLRYAVDFLGVEHVVIVGHTECGGAAACLGAAQNPELQLDSPVTITSLPADSALNRWLAPLTKLVASLKLSSTPREEALPIVVEENVKQQVENLCNTITISDAWTKGTPKGQNVWVHGWVYDIAKGKLKDLNISRGPPERS